MCRLHEVELALCRVLQPGNGQLTGAVPLGTPYPVLRYNGATGYSMCSQFPCARERLDPQCTLNKCLQVLPVSATCSGSEPSDTEVGTSQALRCVMLKSMACSTASEAKGFEMKL